MAGLDEMSDVGIHEANGKQYKLKEKPAVLIVR
jgi:hypothetical protein